MQLLTEKLASQYIKFNFYYLLALLIIFVLAYAYAIVEYPYFFFSDQHEHIGKLLSGNTNFFYNASAHGRLRPMSMTEFYPILTSNLSYENIQLAMYIVQGSEFIIFFVLLYFLLRTCLSFNITILVTSLIFLLGQKQVNFYSLFSHTIFQEQLVIIFLSASLLAYFHAIKKDNTFLFLVSFLSAVIATYYKEPTFAFIFAFAFLQLAFRYKSISFKEKVYLIALLLNSITFIAVYFLFAYKTNHYAVGRVQTPLLETAWNVIARRDYFMIYAFILAFIRAIIILTTLLLKKDNTKFNNADAILASALSYTIIIFAINLNAKYYFMPTFVFTFIALGMYLEQLFLFIIENIKKINIVALTLNLQKFSIEIIRETNIIYSTKYKLISSIITIPIITLFTIGISYELYKYYNRFPEYTHKISKIRDFAALELIHNLKHTHHNIITYLPAADKFPYPHALSVARWRCNIVNIPYKFKFLKEEDNTAIQFFSQNTPENFYKTLDKGALAFLGNSPTNLNSNEKKITDYQSINFTSGARLYYSSNYAQTVEPVLCEFIENLYNLDKKNFMTMFHGHFNDAKRLQCPVIKTISLQK